MSTQLTFADAFAARDAALERIATVTSDTFRYRGERFVLSYLAAHGKTSGEVLTEKGATVAGLRPTDMRHWGVVFRALSMRGAIRCVAYVPRMRGHGTAGGRVWALASD